MPRTTLSSQFSPEQRKSWNPKIVARNTFRYQDGGDVVIRLHRTDIVRKHPDGSVTLDSRSWKTPTTKDRMNRFLPAGYQLQQDAGCWYVVKGGWHSKERVAYFDGIRVPQCFEESNKEGEKTKARELALRKKIKKFVCSVPSEGPLPMPDNGDCWYCLMRTQDGKLLGEATGNNDHILEHVREGYLHGSLIVNALEWAGYRNPGFMFQHGPRTSIRRALKRYLYRQCGLVS